MIIGYTNGYYDLFHMGHVNLIRRARAMCDLLIVGVLTDDVCMRQKNRKCIIPFEQRQDMVIALPEVDMCVPCFEDDKVYEQGKYKFNKLFVGDDHQGTQEWEKLERLLKPLDVPIIYLPYTKEITSSKIRKAVLREEAYQKKTALSQAQLGSDSEAP